MSAKTLATVVVVDDDPFIGRALRTQLQASGFNVLVFESGEDLLAGEIPDANLCLLVDVYMPGMNGIELCRALSAQGTIIPTILMSARDDQQTHRLMRSVQPTGALFKPFDEKMLLRTIRKALRNRSATHR